MISHNSFDLALFYKINQVWTHKALDLFFPWITNLNNHFNFRYIFLPLFLLIFIYFQRGKALRVIASLILVISFSDIFTYHFVKSHVKRLRPINDPQVHAVLRLGHHPHSYSFPSNHSTNGFAVAYTLSSFYPPLSGAFYFLAALIGYSRIYVGVHYPSDILGGIVLGLLIGFFFRKYLFKKWKWFNKYIQ